MSGSRPPSEAFGTSSTTFLGGLNPCSQSGIVLLGLYLLISGGRSILGFCAVVDVAVIIIICFVFQ